MLLFSGINTPDKCAFVLCRGGGLENIARHAQNAYLYDKQQPFA